MAKGLDYLKDAIKWYENRFCVCFTPAVIYALYPKEGEMCIRDRICTLPCLNKKV